MALLYCRASRSWNRSAAYCSTNHCRPSNVPTGITPNNGRSWVVRSTSRYAGRCILHTFRSGSRPTHPQAQEVIDWIKRWHPDHPKIFMGDFNSEPAADEMATIRAALVDVFHTLGVSGDERITFPGGPLGTRTPDGWSGSIDYMWASEHWRDLRDRGHPRTNTRLRPCSCRGTRDAGVAQRQPIRVYLARPKRRAVGRSSQEQKHARNRSFIYPG